MQVVNGMPRGPFTWDDIPHDQWWVPLLGTDLIAVIDRADRGVVCVRDRDWWLTSDGRYAQTSLGADDNGKDLTILMHHLILERNPALDTDHVNNCGIDNRRANLRYATRSQNRANSNVRRDNRSGLKGVRRVGNRYEAGITYKGRRLYLGLFKTAEAAALVYDTKAVELYGAYARTNAKMGLLSINAGD